MAAYDPKRQLTIRLAYRWQEAGRRRNPWSCKLAIEVWRTGRHWRENVLDQSSWDTAV